jgi:manganese transport protein
LILSQVILSLQLGFAIIPLIHFVSDKSKMRDFTLVEQHSILDRGLIIVALNGK